MNRITKIDPDTCPQAISAILSRIQPGRNIVVFKGLAYEVTETGEVWNVGNNPVPFENTWTDKSFGFAPAEPETLSPGETARDTLAQSDQGTKYRIVEDYAGTGKNYRKVYFVHRGERIVCRFSTLRSAQQAYPDASIDLME